MKIIEEQNYKSICEAYKDDFRVFKIYNVNLNTLTKRLTAMEEANRRIAKQYENVSAIGGRLGYLYTNLEREYTLFDIVEKENYLQFSLGGGVCPVPGLIFGITGVVRNSFGYEESIIKSSEHINPDIVFAREGNQISSSQFCELVSNNNSQDSEDIQTGNHN